MFASTCTAHRPVETATFPQSVATSLLYSTNSTLPSDCLSIAEGGSLLGNLSKTNIVYQAYDHNGEPLLWVVSMANGERTLLKNYPGSVSGLGFLKDGQHFLIAIGDGKQVWYGSVDGTAVTKVDLTDELLSNFQAYSPLWSELVGLPENVVDYRYGRFHSPNNQVIASWQRGDKALVLIDQNSQQKTAVVPTGAQDTIDGRWTPDSEWFVFAYNYQTSNSYFGQLFKVNSEGTELKPMTEKAEGSFFISPVLSPDNKKVVFIDSHATDTLGVVWIDSNETRFFPLNLTVASSFGDRTVWSPDSEWIAFFSEGDQIDIRIINIESGHMYCVTEDVFSENLMDWR